MKSKIGIVLGAVGMALWNPSASSVPVSSVPASWMLSKDLLDSPGDILLPQEETSSFPPSTDPAQCSGVILPPQHASFCMPCCCCFGPVCADITDIKLSDEEKKKGKVTELVGPDGKVVIDKDTLVIFRDELIYPKDTMFWRKWSQSFEQYWMKNVSHAKKAHMFGVLPWGPITADRLGLVARMQNNGAKILVLAWGDENPIGTQKTMEDNLNYRLKQAGYRLNSSWIPKQLNLPSNAVCKRPFAKLEK